MKLSMRRVWPNALAVIIIGFRWPACSVIRTLNVWGRTPMPPAKNPAAFLKVVRTDLDGSSLANAVIRLVEDGAVFDTLTYTMLTPFHNFSPCGFQA